MNEIIVKETNDYKKHIIAVEEALKELKKSIKKYGLMNELRKREGFIPRSLARKRKRQLSRSVRHKEAQKNQWLKDHDKM